MRTPHKYSSWTTTSGSVTTHHSWLLPLTDLCQAWTRTCVWISITRGRNSQRSSHPDCTTKVRSLTSYINNDCPDYYFTFLLLLSNETVFVALTNFSCQGSMWRSVWGRCWVGECVKNFTKRSSWRWMVNTWSCLPSRESSSSILWGQIRVTRSKFLTQWFICSRQLGLRCQHLGSWEGWKVHETKPLGRDARGGRSPRSDRFALAHKHNHFTANKIFYCHLHTLQLQSKKRNLNKMPS